jgi:hypothetical protein
MKHVSLIANTGVQFIDFTIDLSEESDAIKVRTLLAEIEKDLGNGEKEFELEFPYHFESQDIYIVENEINKEAIDSETGFIDEEKIRAEFIREIDEDFIFTIRSRDSINLFEDTWLPIPYFRQKTSGTFHFGPLTWARVYISKIPEREKDGKQTHKVVLAIDTTCSDGSTELNSKSYTVPNLIDADGSAFRCQSSKVDIYNYCAAVNKTEEDEIYEEDYWVLNWLEKTYKSLCNAKNIRKNEKNYYYVGLYLNFIEVLNKTGDLPVLTLHESAKEPLEVDLILDIGNNRTCGILFQSTNIDQSFNFSKAMPLELRDLSYPNKTYSDPFDMTLAFVEAEFGRADFYNSGNPNAFTWPSIIRIGSEAKRLMTIVANGQMSNTAMSSPKRYLWDNKPSKYPWEFITENKISTSLRPKPAINKFLTEYFTDDGSFIPAANSKKGEHLVALTSNYSRSSLMTFVMIELILHSISFINSYKFRHNKGDELLPRKLRRIVLTCPTAMTIEEKVTLRLRAQNAVLALKNCFSSMLIDQIEVYLPEDASSEVNNANFDITEGLQIIPNPRDISKPDKQKSDWGYDEATCVQLAFVYGEIFSRFNGNANLFFQLNGKKRKNMHFDNASTITVASVDIGGGTTDLMICAYQNDPDSQVASLVPQPLFWDGFNFAGDDIIKRIIERLVIPPIGKYAKLKDGKEVHKTLKLLLGTETVNTTAKDIGFRKQFSNQIAIPIAYYFMTHATQNLQTSNVSWSEIFSDISPNAELIDFINNEFRLKAQTKDFDIRETKWDVDTNAINLVVQDILEKMIGELSTIISQYQCDFLLLAGRPTTLPIVEEMFLRYLPVWPGRIVKLGNYRIGEWYPFHDGLGRIKDPKTCVVVGATISLMSKLGRLDGFRIDPQYLKSRIVSTANYIGKYDKDTATIDSDFTYLTPQKSTCIIKFEGPTQIGFKQMKGSDWTASPLYRLCFASAESAANLSHKLPLMIEINRDFDVNKEKLEYEANIVDNNNQPVSSKEIAMVLQSLVDESGYWMDTGKFDLPIFDDF